MGRMRTVVVLALVLALSGCAGSLVKTTEITGESIVGLGNTFAATATAMTNGCIAKTYTVATCDSFRAFGQRFQAAYPLAKSMWNIAAAAQDKTATANLNAIFVQWSTDLVPFTNMVLGVK